MRNDKILVVLVIVLLSGYLMAGVQKDGQEVPLQKIDSQATLGLLGTNNSLAYRVHEIEKHFHSRGRYFGISADQSGNDWNESVSDAGMPTAFQAISGSAAYGADADDEAKVIGTADTCGITDMVKFDLHEIFVDAASVTTHYILRIVYGTGTMADAITAEKYAEYILEADAAVGQGVGFIFKLQMPRLTWGTDKVWIQVKNATDNATLSFYVGLHCYAG